MRLIASHHISRLYPDDAAIVPAATHWPKDMSSTRIAQLYTLCLIPDPNRPVFHTAQDHCAWWHTHAPSSPCYTSLAQTWKSDTPSLLSSMYSSLRARNAAAHVRELDAHMKTEPANKHARDIYRIQADAVQWSLRQEEGIAEIWCEAERLAGTILPGAAKGGDGEMRDLERRLEEEQRKYRRGCRYYQERFVERDGCGDVMGVGHGDTGADGVYSDER
jgi:hypothetical protein